MTPARFQTIVWRYYREHGRHDLPWRKTHDLYHILVSEVMLQQTQVERVRSFYAEFTKRFPTAKKLAEAKLSEVVKVWQGLGYNRRAKMLREATKELDLGRSDSPKKTIAELEELPGVGPYTARAIAAFAYNEDTIVIETNIRTVVIHHFFSDRKDKISDAEIEKVLARALPQGRAREWYSALMDYGASLKRAGVSHNARTKAAAKQTKFAGSLRQARGAILRELARGAQSAPRLAHLLGDDRCDQLHEALGALIVEGLVRKEKRKYVLTD